jgi:Cu(I)/Ag(I) efflux system membrane fusion protein
MRFWSGQKRTITSAIADIRNATDISGMRKGFFTISKSMLDVSKRMGISLNGNVYEVFCPMAFDNKGATWLQQDENIRNPYFGSAMRNCGEVKNQLAVD